MTEEIKGGIGPLEAAAIAAALAQVIAEQEAAALRGPRSRSSAWVDAELHDAGYVDNWSGLRQGLRSVEEG
ncbi:MAG: hypothetical protein OEM22_00805 [Acidimicrobiia bacterium]|nr:hypothetical protein [Acidimicrobiia bacterium]MDH3470819.1 hypothetical protein [Acidimicrobiia bacterium]